MRQIAKPANRASVRDATRSPWTQTTTAAKLRYAYPYPCPNKRLQTPSCTYLLYTFVIQIVLGMGMGMNVTAQQQRDRPDMDRALDGLTNHIHLAANRHTKILDVRGFYSNIIFILRGGIPMPIGDFPETLSQAILVGRILARRLGVLWSQRVCLQRQVLPADPGALRPVEVRAGGGAVLKRSR